MLPVVTIENDDVPCGILRDSHNLPVQILIYRVAQLFERHLVILFGLTAVKIIFSEEPILPAKG